MRRNNSKATARYAKPEPVKTQLSSTWLKDENTTGSSLAAWLETPALPADKNLSSRSGLMAVTIIGQALRAGQSWSVAFAIAAQTASPAAGKILHSVSADIARGAPVSQAVSTLPDEMAGWLALASVAKNPEDVLKLAGESLSSQSHWRQATRRWLPVSALAALVVVALCWLVGGILVPQLTSSVPSEYISWMVQASPWVSLLLALTSLGVVAFTAVAFYKAARPNKTISASYILSAQVDIPWASRLDVAARVASDKELFEASRSLSSGASLELALSATRLAPASPMIQSGADPTVAFAALARALDQSRLRKAQLTPLVVLWFGVLAAAVLLTGTVLTVVIPLVQTVSR